MYRPPLPEFLERATVHGVVPVYRQLLGDTLTPVSAFRKVEAGDWAFLFETVIGGERGGRYRFLGAEPFLLFRAWDRKVLIEDLRTGGREEIVHDDPLRLLQEWLDRYRA